jgi:hypothetical protein
VYYLALKLGDSDLRLTLNVEVAPEGGVSEQKVEETKLALRELGLEDNIEIIEDRTS